MNKIIVLVDSREKIKLEFPKAIHVFTEEQRNPKILPVLLESKQLNRGDYTLEGFEDVVGIERKGAVGEIVTNLMTTDRLRAMQAFRRFAQIKHPILMLDFNILQFFPPLNNPANILMYEAYSRLCHLADELKIELWQSGNHNASKNRITLGYAVLYRMLSKIDIEASGVSVRKTKDELCRLE